ncbi:MAG: copper resistance protein CopC [Gammaproteobacteria bacterium]|nr:MAG: copper resistance protein CopC [Gammaproteobacteria bacterium]
MSMKILSLLFGLALVTSAVTASAHAHLQKSSPADNSVITTSPAVLVLNFSEAARLTALSIQKGSEPRQKLKPLPTTAAQQISVPLPRLTPGSYSVSWRVVSADGHVMSGTLRFTLAPERAAEQPAPH